MTATVAIVLAAGQGTRMKSAKPKVLHALSGRSLVGWATAAALEAGADECVVVVGYEREQVKADLLARFEGKVRFVVQEQQLGTGHAVRCAFEQALADFEGKLLVTYGDCPLVKNETLSELLTAGEGKDCALLVARKEEPRGYGRMIRDAEGRVVAIREHRDCNEAELAITEVNPGVYCFDAAFARKAIAKIDTNNAQGELYLTDLVALAASQGEVVDVASDMAELQGVNDRAELAACGAVIRRRILEGLARAGTDVIDLSATYVDADCKVGVDVILQPGVHLRGACEIMDGATIDAGCVLTNVVVEQGAHLLPYTVATDSRIGKAANVGPFSHLRPLTILGEGAKVGNFCETKKTTLGKGSKVNHLAYVGDGQIGEGVNIGAGVIFCNYDGVKKHTTVLEDGVFIGSDSQLVAPLVIGKGAYVASGSTVTRDVPANALAISRTKQDNKEGYASRLRARMKAKK